MTAQIINLAAKRFERKSQGYLKVIYFCVTLVGMAMFFFGALSMGYERIGIHAVAWPKAYLVALTALGFVVTLYGRLKSWSFQHANPKKVVR